MIDDFKSSTNRFSTKKTKTEIECCLVVYPHGGQGKKEQNGNSYTTDDVVGIIQLNGIWKKEWKEFIPDIIGRAPVIADDVKQIQSVPHIFRLIAKQDIHVLRKAYTPFNANGKEQQHAQYLRQLAWKCSMRNSFFHSWLLINR